MRRLSPDSALPTSPFRRSLLQRALLACWGGSLGLAWAEAPVLGPDAAASSPVQSDASLMPPSQDGAVPGASPWRPDHIVLVVLENLSAFDATELQRQQGDAPVYAATSNWRCLNSLAQGGARLTHSHFARSPYGSDLPTRASQPNYLYLFSGHHQGVLPGWFEDSRSPYAGLALNDRQGRPLLRAQPGTVGVANNNLPLSWLPLTSPNLGAALMQSGRSFASFCESLPYPSWNCGTDDRMVFCSASHALSDDYRRKHNPTVNWTDQIAPTSERARHGDLAHNVLPIEVNLGFAPTRDPVLQRSFRGFVQDAKGQALSFDQLPHVSIVVPNEQHDAHSNSARVADDWLQQNLGAYAQWAREHNSLLIVTFDEDGSTDTRRGDPYITGTHRIATVFHGAKVKQGDCAKRVDHLNVLATVLWLNGALDRFKADYHRFHGVVDGSGSEAELAYLNLQPIQELFDLPPASPATAPSPAWPAASAASAI